ncbi:conserved hypothetical protein (plasmid) [Gloeothece citriformis PCC 7424]|uniref:Sulfotransferase n=1 Tax=Gloeothece citriformis (strain PCC 7424) TaxID=65393 RepID=B7KLP5_GLOC7|nr:sulfotransferase [Gloeothece citriformis]ACK73717.1 conserved hypothetical protein [Gloeothece citriformis PCC 7424]
MNQSQIREKSIIIKKETEKLTVKQPYRSLRYHLFNWVGTVSSAVGMSRISLEKDSLLESAQRLTGLEDFGDEWFLTPLQILLKSLEKEAQLNYMGRFLFRLALERLLVSRLRIEEDLKRYPEITEVPIQRPLFILGLPRSGTTYLHNLLSQDPQSRWLHLWELINPSPPPDYATKETDPRLQETARLVKASSWLIPQLNIAHYINPTGPEECLTLFEHDMASVLFELRANVPTYGQWLEKQTLQESYSYYRKQLQLLSWKWPGQHWVLKAPMHARYLSTLLRVFPDACIVFSHRDPKEVVPSLCSLSAMFRGAYSEHLELKTFGKQWLEWLGKIVDRSIEVRFGQPQQQFFDVYYSDLVTKPIETVHRIYEYFGYPYSEAMEENLKQYVKDNPQHKHGVHYYSLEQFGLKKGEIEERFQGYTQKFPI